MHGCRAWVLASLVEWRPSHQSSQLARQLASQNTSLHYASAHKAHLVGRQVGGVEAHTKLANHGDVGARGQGLQQTGGHVCVKDGWQGNAR